MISYYVMIMSMLHDNAAHSKHFINHLISHDLLLLWRVILFYIGL